MPVTVEGVLARALSKSYISVLPDDEKKEVADSLKQILETEQKIWVTEDVVFEYPYETTVVTVLRK